MKEGKKDNKWLFQENVFCFLAFLLSALSMVLRMLDIKNECSDICLCIAYAFALGLWRLITNEMREKMSIFFERFNECAPTITVVGSALFYLFLVMHCDKAPWFILVAMVVSTISTTYYYFKKKRRSAETKNQNGGN